MDMSGTCATCRFWTGATCYRYPPQFTPYLGSSDDRAAWPRTKADWCGEWKEENRK